jgi:hypothetical protein
VVVAAAAAAVADAWKALVRSAFVALGSEANALRADLDRLQHPDTVGEGAPSDIGLESDGVELVRDTGVQGGTPPARRRG